MIGIFWTRLGTAVAGAQSGTEHELLRACAVWQTQGRPHILIHFSKQKAKDVDGAQLLALQQFMQRLPKEGLWWPYPSSSKFPGIVRRHLTRLLRDHYGTAT